MKHHDDICARVYKVVYVHAMRAYGVVEVWLQSFLTSALNWSDRSALGPSPFTSMNRRLVGGALLLKVSLDVLEKRKVCLCLCRESAAAIQPVAHMHKSDHIPSEERVLHFYAIHYAGICSGI